MEDKYDYRISQGSCGNVYKQGSKAVKVYKETGQVPKYEDINQLVGIQNDTVVFPEELSVDENGKVTSYVMDFVNGRLLGDTIKQLDFKLLQTAIETAEQNLQGVVKEKVLFNDLNVGNIMWDDEKKSIRIIDTDFFKRDLELTEENVYKYNLRNFNNQMETIIGIRDGNLANFLVSIPEYTEFQREYFKRSLKGENVSTAELLQTIRNVAEKEFNTTFSNLAEIEEALMSRDEVSNKKMQNSAKMESIPIFTPPEEQDEEKFEPPQTSIKEKIKQSLSKIPLVRKFLNRNQKLLEAPKEPKEPTRPPIKDNKSFIAELSNNGEYRKLPFGQPVKEVIAKTNEIFEKENKLKKAKTQPMADKGKVDNMKNTMQGPDLE